MNEWADWAKTNISWFLGMEDASRKEGAFDKIDETEEEREEREREERDFLEVAQLNAQQGKNYAAGILPVCIGADDNEPYLLLGRQDHPAVVKYFAGMKDQWAARLDKTEGYCIFWGWQDKGDLSVEDTAAREGTEESLSVVGNRQFILEWLKDRKCRKMLWPYGFMISLGKLDKHQRQQIVKRFKKKRRLELNPVKREMIELKWVNCRTMYKAFEEWNGVDRMTLPEFKDRHLLREWLPHDLKTCIFDEPLRSFCLHAVDPFEGQRDRFGEWLRWEWVPEEEKRKQQSQTNEKEKEEKEKEK